MLIGDCGFGKRCGLCYVGSADAVVNCIEGVGNRAKSYLRGRKVDTLFFECLKFAFEHAYVELGKGAAQHNGSGLIAAAHSEDFRLAECVAFVVVAQHFAVIDSDVAEVVCVICGAFGA